jgi:hypothetical protein
LISGEGRGMTPRLPAASPIFWDAEIGRGMP